MTTPSSPPSGLLAGVLSRLDWVSSVGARALRITAITGSVAAAAIWLLVGRTWGVAGVVVLLVTLLPAGFLWWYARGLDAAVNRTTLELSVGELLSKAGGAVSEVVGARKERFGLVRAGWRAVASVRELRQDVERLGLDLAAWATVANPGSLAVAALSVVASAALVGIAAGVAVLVAVL